MKCCRYDDGESVLATGSLERPGPAGDQLCALESAADPAPQPQLNFHLYITTTDTRLAVTEGSPSKPPPAPGCHLALLAPLHLASLPPLLLGARPLLSN